MEPMAYRKESMSVFSSDRRTAIGGQAILVQSNFALPLTGKGGVIFYLKRCFGLNNLPRVLLQSFLEDVGVA